MRFSLYAVALMQAAYQSNAVLIESEELARAIAPSLDQTLAQVESENQNAVLIDALNKVISSMATNAPANNQPANAAKPDAAAKPEADAKAKAEPEAKAPAAAPAAAPAKKSAEAGTNIAITTATDQHINIFVPEDPSGKVTVKKTDGVKIVESDSDKADKNADVKKAIGDKIKGKLVKKAMKDSSSDDDSSDESDSGKKKIAKAGKKIKDAKAKSQKMKKALNKAGH